MSSVYLSMDISLNKQWAVKEIGMKEKSINPVLFNAAKKEAYLLKNLDHPTLPRVVDIFEENDAFYVVMDYINGRPLSLLVKKFGPVPEKKVLDIARILCDTLIYLHGRTPPIIHRDLKPGNLLLTDEGNIKLIDFGIAREKKQGSMRDTSFLGTKGYAAPEQYKALGQTDQRTDIYSFGVTLYTLLTGKDPTEPPYEIYPIRRWNKNLSRGLENIVKKCTREDPGERYKDARELLYALNHVEEEDHVYLGKLKRRLVTFLTFVGLFLGTAIFGSFSLFYGSKLKTNDYENNISLANTAKTDGERISFYEKAIAIRPGDIRGYVGMMDCFKSDGTFSQEEEELIDKKLNLNINYLKNSEDYGMLAYKMGKLYWYYYDYGNDSERSSGMKRGAGWFEDAISYLPKDSEEYSVSSVYAGIGGFIRDITLNIEEASDSGMYGEYFSGLRSLVNITEEENNEIVRLSSLRLVLSSVDTYLDKFKGDGVEKDEILGLFLKSKDMLRKTTASTDKSKSIKNDLISRLTYIEDNLTAYFEEKEKV